MKRYTGQQALYEAISRSRGKAKRGSILEKLRPVLPKEGDPVAPQPQPPAELTQLPVETPGPVVLEPSEPQAAEMPPQPVVEQDAQVEPLVESLPEVVTPSEPAVKPRPVERLASAVLPSRVQAWLRPRPVQFNEGRIEVSVPYYVGLIAALVLCMVVLIAFRLGQARAGGQAPAAVNPGGVSAERPARPAAGNPATTDASRTLPNAPAVTADQKNVVPAVSGGDHLIVLTTYGTDRDLEPVRQHFARYGISLEILPLDRAAEVWVQCGFDPATAPRGSGFWLVTRLCSNPKIPGSDGEKLKQRITEVGALYKGKAPQGYESFAPHYFSDAYGKKVK